MKMYRSSFMKKIFIYAILLLLFRNAVVGQNPQHSESHFLELPPLNEIIDTAFINSPLLKAQGKAIEGIQEEIKTERRKWMDHLYFEGAANYGIYDNLVVNSVANSVDINNGIISRNEQVRYYGGVSLKLPLSSISSSTSKIKVKQLEQEQATYQMQQLREDIKNIIIEEYFHLKYLQESMQTYNRINQTLEISVMQAEKDLTNGQIEFDEFGILVSTTGKSKNDYLKAKNSFQAQYKKLETLAGITLKPKKN